MITIRTATLSDLPAIRDLEAACFPPAEAAGEESLAKRLSVFADHFWLMEQDGTLIAMVNGMVTDTPNLMDEMYDLANLHRADGAWQMIFGVDTAPDKRHLGYASTLLKHVISEARSEGRKGLVLTCKTALIPFYARLGFVNEGLSASVHGDAQWYQMRLSF